MIESNNPEINVDKLMVKIQEEVSSRIKRDLPNAVIAHRDSIAENFSAADWHHIEAHLTTAEQNADAGGRLLPMLRFKKSVRWMARLTGRMVIFLSQVVTIPQRHFNQSIWQVLKTIVAGIRGMNDEMTNQQTQLANIETALSERFADIEHRQAEQLAKLEHRLAERDNQINELSEIISYLKSSLILQERRLSTLLEEARRRLPESLDNAQLRIFADEAEHLMDPLYVSFEDQFRGTRQEIMHRFEVYLPLVREIGAGTDDRPILDLGCGRGEWLELLREQKLKAHGLDINRVLVQQCRQNRLEVAPGDLLSYLHTMPDASLGLVTGFHIIEHLPFRVVIELLDETCRVLKSGGMAIFETPTPQNLLVGACNFWSDPTHLRPLYPETQEFLMEHRGFSKVEIMFLHPHEAHQRLPETEAPQLAARLNDLLSCARDYAVLGYKV